MLNEAFSPAHLAGDDEEGTTPGLAALSVISSREDFWRPHCLLVEFATSTVSNPIDPYAILSKLHEHALEKWAYERQFLDYLENHPYGLPKAQLRFTLNLLAQTLTPGAVAEAQAGTVKIYACLDECPNDVDCFHRCMKR
ncbi:hypothetical protein [Streptomyces turgidiscabies]